MSSLNSTSKGSWGVGLRKAAQLACGAMAVLLLSLPLFSQGNAGRILGTVVDQSGGTVAGATVTVIDTERGVTKTLVTNEAGEYNAPNLTPGNYKVRAEAKGFKVLERQNVVLEVGKEIRVDLTVQPGEQAQTVTVTESVPLVETTNATLGGTLNNTDINDMPLNGRNYQSLLALRPGVVIQPGGGPWTQSSNNVRPMNPAGCSTALSTSISMTPVPSPICRVRSQMGRRSCPSTPSRNSTSRKIPRQNMAGSPAPS